jgi:tRNA A37 methylthiotransferase MiaB
MSNQPADLKTTVGLAQIGAISYHRRVGNQWHMKNGFPVMKPSPFQPRDYMYLPYSVGLLQAFIQKHAAQPDLYQFLPLIYSPLPIAESVEQLKTADIVGFSTYIWNIQLSLAVARRLKEERPNVVIVFGGPQVPDHAEAFLRENPFVDVACHGPGEETFLKVLENLSGRSWDNVPSISYLHEDGSFVATRKPPRNPDLSIIPSPYLEGVFDQIIAANPEQDWLVMWETNRGCPFSCTFCDWGSATASKVFRFEMDRLLAELDWFAEKKVQHVFVCDANFGIFPRDIELTERVLSHHQNYGYPRFLSVQNSKNATERTYQIQKLLAQMSSMGATLSMQSLDKLTLINIKRDNISLDSFHELSSRYRRDNIKTYTDILLGLPGETYDTFTNGLSNLLKNGQHFNIKFYNTSILPNAEMGDPAYQKRFGMQTVPLRIMNHHDSLADTEHREVQEYLETVVATDAMPHKEWARARAFVWMLELLHFGRMLQVPFVTLAEAYNASYRHMVEQFLDVDGEAYPVLGVIRDMFMEQARGMQAGQPEYKASEEWLGIWWPIEHYALVWMVKEKKLNSFYKEVESLLAGYLQTITDDFDQQLLHDALHLSKSLMTLPFKMSDLEIELSYNIWEYYRGILTGERVPLTRQNARYHVDRTSKIWLTWESWLLDVLPRTDAKEAFSHSIKRLPGKEQPVVPAAAEHAPMATAYGD